MINDKFNLKGLYLNISGFYEKKPAFVYLTLFAASFLIFTWLQATPTMADPDSFYHVKLTQLMLEKVEQGELPVFKNFPWLQFTTLKNIYTDHHFLYHLLLLPFVKYYDPILGAKFFTIIFCSLLITIFYWLLKQFKVKNALILTLMLLTSVGFIFRISLIKAQTLALIIFFLNLYAILNRKLFLVFLLSIIYVLSYAGWIFALIIALFYILSESIAQLFANNKVVNIKSLSAIGYQLLAILKLSFTKKNLLLITVIISGLVAGVVSHPYFPQNLQFYWQQTFQIGLLNEKSQVAIGAEWYVPPFPDFFFNNLLILAAWVLACAWFFFTAKSQNSKSWTLFFLSNAFLILALRSRRHIEYFTPLAIFFAGLSLTHNPFSNNYPFEWKKLFQKFKTGLMSPNHLINILVIAYIVLGLFIVGIYQANQVNTVQSGLASDQPLLYLRNASMWLEKNTPAGANIFHSSWDEFPILFYQNHHNYYIVGLDATFMYNYDHFLYQLWRNITDRKDQSGLAYKIKKIFKSDYILVTKKRREAFAKVLKHQADIKKVYEDDEAYIFKITNNQETITK